MFKYSFLFNSMWIHVDCYLYIIISQILYISIPCGGKHLHVAMNSKLNQAYLLPPASGLTLLYAGISKTMNETMIWPGESGNKIITRTSFVYRWLIVACIYGLLDHKGSAIDYFITRFTRSYGFVHSRRRNRHVKKHFQSSARTGLRTRDHRIWNRAS